MVYGTPLNSLGRWSNESIFLAVCTTFQSYLSHLDVVYFAVEVLIYGFDLETSVLHILRYDGDPEEFLFH